MPFFYKCILHIYMEKYSCQYLYSYIHICIHLCIHKRTVVSTLIIIYVLVSVNMIEPESPRDFSFVSVTTIYTDVNSIKVLKRMCKNRPNAYEYSHINTNMSICKSISLCVDIYLHTYVYISIHMYIHKYISKVIAV
jgi:hypothetical protein